MGMKLHNKSQRVFTVGSTHFAPGQTLEFSDDTGARLRHLYPNEIINIDDVAKVFDQEVEKHVDAEPKHNPVLPEPKVAGAKEPKKNVFGKKFKAATEGAAKEDVSEGEVKEDEKLADESEELPV